MTSFGTTCTCPRRSVQVAKETPARPGAGRTRAPRGPPSETWSPVTNVTAGPAAAPTGGALCPTATAGDDTTPTATNPVTTTPPSLLFSVTLWKRPKTAERCITDPEPRTPRANGYLLGKVIRWHGANPQVTTLAARC